MSSSVLLASKSAVFFMGLFLIEEVKLINPEVVDCVGKDFLVSARSLPYVLVHYL